MGAQGLHTTHFMENIAGEPVRVETISGCTYVFGSELATLRIFAKYQTYGSIHNPNARWGYSVNLKEHYFALTSGI